MGASGWRGGVRVPRRKRTVNPKDPFLVINGNSSKPVTPWINHPMGPTGWGYQFIPAPLRGIPAWGALLGEVEPKWHHVLTQAKDCSSNQDALESKDSGQKYVYRENPPIKRQELSLLGRDSSRAAVRLRNHERRVPKHLRNS